MGEAPAARGPVPSRVWPTQGQETASEVREEVAQHSGNEKQAAILIGPEFGAMTRTHLVESAREAGADVLICCAFTYDAQATDMQRHGRIPIIKARMNADLHMPLVGGRRSNLFVVFGEPDIEILEDADAPGQIRVKVKGADIHDPQRREVRSHEPHELACWLIDADCSQERLFARHACFLGASDPYGKLRTALKAGIDPDA